MKTEAQADGQWKCGLEEKGLSREETQHRAVWRQLVRYINTT